MIAPMMVVMRLMMVMMMGHNYCGEVDDSYDDGS